MEMMGSHREGESGGGRSNSVTESGDVKTDCSRRLCATYGRSYIPSCEG